ncbi:MAG TPA: tRNA epoxyqueuosine(34) reductase QueG [Candidatus Dormibacteraeota bacterium]|nr:tRNA epoxyqueuosine(34) reductase QueG [Candidatus Dormibacteraeota bacterium]
MIYSVEDTRWVVARARAIGFDLAGIAPASQFPELARLSEWLERGYAGEMHYLKDPRRGEPHRILPGAKSVIVCALNYNAARSYSTGTAADFSFADHCGPRGWISRYAWGDDYHDVLRGKLQELIAALREHIRESFDARAYVDTGPIVERIAAKHAGLGWLAKNTCLINEQLGSWLFLGAILTTLDFTPSLEPHEMAAPDLCGNCSLCIDACPTGALVEPYVLDARRCISYLTIELRGGIPTDLRGAMGRHVFGCDICQDVCPWNRKAPITSLPALQPRVRPVKGKAQSYPESYTEEFSSSPAHSQESLFHPHLEWLAALSEEDFRQVFRGSAVKRAKWRGLIRNACVALGNSGVCPGSPEYSRITNLLTTLSNSVDPVIAEHAAWALRSLG